VADDWISAETEAKERDFTGILEMHTNVCRGIFKRHGTSSYLYADLYAGPGRLEFEGRQFDGSPLIAQRILTATGLPYLALHYERDASVAARLGGALWTPSSLLDTPDAERAPVFTESCQEGFRRWLEVNGKQPGRYGLVYSDPIRDEIPHELLNLTAQYLPKVDLLSYVAATQYKRRRGVDPSRPFLVDHIGAIDKRVALIREPIGRWQWTFVLWSNWVNLPEWRKRGFYRVDSDRGQEILDLLNLSKPELHAARNTPLPLDDFDKPYHSYAEYLRHPRFLEVRAVAFKRAGGRCERCGQRPPSEPHHLRYPPWGTFDVPENLIAICHQCHCEIHGKAA
jgi:hypothetical protein